MNKIELRNDLTTSLVTLYDLEIFASMMEYCQGEMRVLIYLELNNGNEVYPSDISESLHVTRQRITSILSSLRKKGYVSMETAENDRRRKKVVLTKNARKYVITKGKWIESYFDTLIEKLGEENTQELTRLINLSIEQLKQQEDMKIVQP